MTYNVVTKEPSDCDLVSRIHCQMINICSQNRRKILAVTDLKIMVREKQLWHLSQGVEVIILYKKCFICGGELCGKVVGQQ